MQEKFTQIKNDAINDCLNVTNSKQLNDLKVKYVGKNGEITALLRGMKDVPADQRSAFGKMINDLKNEVEATLMEMVDDGTFAAIAEEWGVSDLVCLGK